MLRFNSYKSAEESLIKSVVTHPDFVTGVTHERIGVGFTLTDPTNNRNDRSNYEYAKVFFDWMMSGEKMLSEKILSINPWVKRFVDTAGLPDNFSSSYGYKILGQLDEIMFELLHKKDSRRAFINILVPDDQVILKAATTHEYPCTIGLHFMIRDKKLHLIVNMRSNNLYSVMPYDVYNFTMLLQYVAEVLEIPLGFYHHIINSAHIYKGDVRRINSIKNESSN